MALAFKTIQYEGITFNGKEYPLTGVTMERRMRVARLSAMKEERADELVDILAECFGDAKDEVKEKLKAIPISDFMVIVLYIMNGEEAVAEYSNKKMARDAEEEANE